MGKILCRSFIYFQKVWQALTKPSGYITIMLSVKVSVDPSILPEVKMGEYLCFILFFLGLVMIIKGSDWFIEAVIWVAKVFHIPYIIIGATIVSICTTLPETFVSVTAAIKGDSNYAFGNAIGSIAVNTGLIMAVLLVFAGL